MAIQPSLFTEGRGQWRWVFKSQNTRRRRRSLLLDCTSNAGSCSGVR